MMQKEFIAEQAFSLIDYAYEERQKDLIWDYQSHKTKTKQDDR